MIDFKAIQAVDPELCAAMKDELTRQREHIELIASENFASPAVIAAMGSILTNKYAEGLPGKRYYGGCHYVDEIEQLCIDRAKACFGAEFANVQPHSGAQANMAVQLALLQPGRPMGETLASLLLYGYQAQGQLEGEEELPFDARSALAGIRDFARPGRWQEIPEYFLSLEILTEPWARLLRNPRPGSWDGRTLALARYLVERYWLQAVSDFDLYCRVKFIVIFCLVTKILGGDLLHTAQLASKEIENNTENVEAILDAAYAHGAFTDEKLLGYLLARDKEETP